MTPSEDEPDDGALDAMLQTIARADAPRDFAARVSEAVDGRNSSPVAGQRVRLTMAAAAGVLAIALAVWIASRHSASSPTAPLSARSTPASAGHARPAFEPVPQSTIPEAARAVIAVPAMRANQHRRLSHRDDHDRALPALDALPAVLQPDIAPPSLETTSIEIGPVNAIAPLTVQGGRDTSGRGDF